MFSPFWGYPDKKDGLCKVRCSFILLKWTSPAVGLTSPLRALGISVHGLLFWNLICRQYTTLAWGSCFDDVSETSCGVSGETGVVGGVAQQYFPPVQNTEARIVWTEWFLLPFPDWQAATIPFFKPLLMSFIHGIVFVSSHFGFIFKTKQTKKIPKQAMTWWK